MRWTRPDTPLSHEHRANFPPSTPTTPPQDTPFRHDRTSHKLPIPIPPSRTSNTTARALPIPRSPVGVTPQQKVSKPSPSESPRESKNAHQTLPDSKSPPAGTPAPDTKVEAESRVLNAPGPDHPQDASNSPNAAVVGPTRASPSAEQAVEGTSAAQGFTGEPSQKPLGTGHVSQCERPCEPHPSELPLEDNSELAHRTTSKPVTPGPTANNHHSHDEGLQNTRNVHYHEPASTKARAPPGYTAPPHQEPTPNPQPAQGSLKDQGDTPYLREFLHFLGANNISEERRFRDANPILYNLILKPTISENPFPRFMAPLIPNLPPMPNAPNLPNATTTTYTDMPRHHDHRSHWEVASRSPHGAPLSPWFYSADRISRSKLGLHLRLDNPGPP